MVFLSKRHQILLLWFFSTALIAFGIIGIAPINPQNINWLQIANPDSLTNYLGWVFYRFSPWSWPIGLNPNYGLEISSSIVFSDSIPLLAFLFKPINFILPETFKFLKAEIGETEGKGKKAKAKAKSVKVKGAVKRKKDESDEDDFIDDTDDKKVKPKAKTVKIFP